MSEEEQKPSQPDPSSKSDEKAPVLQYFTSSASDTKLVTIRRLPSFQAQLAKAKLEAEGIQCFVQEDNFNVVYPVFFNDVPVQVAQTDAELAKEILDRPAAAAAEGEYADEEYRCRKCHRKNVDLVPLSAGPKRLRRAYVIFLLLPLVLLAVKWLFPDPHLISQIDSLEQSAAIGWILIALVGGIVVVGIKRRKRCRDCGYEWGSNERSKASV